MGIKSHYLKDNDDTIFYTKSHINAVYNNDGQSLDELLVLLHEDGTSIIYSDSFADFPVIGVNNRLYIDSEARLLYRWRTDENAYEKLSSKEIEDLTALSHTHENLEILNNTSESFTGSLKTDYDSAYHHSTLPHAPAQAQENIQSDWQAVEGDASIKNKPTLGTASAKDIEYFATAAQGNTAASAIQHIYMDGIEQEKADTTVNLPTYPTRQSLIIDNTDNTSDLEKPISYLVQDALDSKADKHHIHENEEILNMDASKLYGQINLELLPHGALERCIIVADDTARFALTSKEVQMGDTVNVVGNREAGELPKMYFVINEEKLDREEGYTVYTAETASSVPWPGVTGKPSTYPPTLGETDITAYQGSKGKIAYDHAKTIHNSAYIKRGANSNVEESLVSIETSLHGFKFYSNLSELGLEDSQVVSLGVIADKMSSRSIFVQPITGTVVWATLLPSDLGYLKIEKADLNRTKMEFVAYGGEHNISYQATYGGNKFSGWSQTILKNDLYTYITDSDVKTSIKHIAERKNQGCILFHNCTGLPSDFKSGFVYYYSDLEKTDSIVLNYHYVINSKMITAQGYLLKNSDTITWEYDTTYKLSGGTELPANTDLDTLLTLGNYYCPTDSIATTLLNSPSFKAFTMQIGYPTGINAYIFQRLTTNDGKVHFRIHVTKTQSWEPWNSSLLSHESQRWLGVLSNIDVLELKGNCAYYTSDTNILNGDTYCFYTRLDTNTNSSVLTEYSLIHKTMRIRYKSNEVWGVWMNVAMASDLNGINQSLTIKRINAGEDLNTYSDIERQHLLFYCDKDVLNSPCNYANIIHTGKTQVATNIGDNVDIMMFRHYSVSLKAWSQWTEVALNNNTYQLSGGIVILEKEDLSDLKYTKPGNYYCVTNEITRTLKNVPTNAAFTMKVDYGVGHVGARHPLPRQILTDYLGNMYTRYYNDMLITWSNWERFVKDKEAYLLSGGTIIPANEDLNNETYKVIGNYYCLKDEIAKTLMNCPIPIAFTLKVFQANGSNTYIAQELKNYHSNQSYYRYYNNEASKWVEWNSNVITSDLDGFYKLSGGSEILEHTDLNADAYKKVGSYYCPTIAKAATIINSPIQQAFTLKVELATGTGYPSQIITNYLDGKKYFRTFNDTVRQWGEWNSNVIETDLPTSPKGASVYNIGTFDTYDKLIAALDTYYDNLKSGIGYCTLFCGFSDPQNGSRLFAGGFTIFTYKSSMEYGSMVAYSYDQSRPILTRYRSKSIWSDFTCPFVLDNNAYKLSGGTKITANEDLNDVKYKEPGNYYCTLNTTAQTLINCPSTYGFTMKVEYSNGLSINPCQTVTNYYTGKKHYRVYGINGWNPWVAHVLDHELNNCSSLDGGTIIPANEDLNNETYKVVGNYCCLKDEIAKTLMNCPIPTAFTLKVFQANGSNTYIAQELKNYHSNQSYYRYYNNEASKWVEWNSNVINSDLNNVYKLTGGTAISESADLNNDNYRIPGNYACSGIDIAQSLLNCPTKEAFTMKVAYSTGGSMTYLSQTIIAMGGRQFYRFYNRDNKTWSKWSSNVITSDLDGFYKLSGGTEIPENADLNMNTYKIIGNYYCKSNSTAQTLLNCPITIAFTLKVFQPNGISSYIGQELKHFHTNQSYYRYYDYSFNKWGDWIPNVISQNGAIMTHAIGDDANTYIAYPSDGRYRFTNGSAPKIGYLKITLPQSWTDTMVKFTVTFYNYETNTSSEYTVSGYTYLAQTKWYLCSAYSLGKVNMPLSNLPVNFGHDGTKCAVYIGNPDTTWSYPQVTIKDITVGFKNYEYEKWVKGWNIDYVTVLGTITSTITSPHVGALANTLVGMTTTIPELNFVKGVTSNIQTQIDALKKSVSDGKKLVADAITSKGKAMAADATFQVMASNIQSIATDGFFKYARIHNRNLFDHTLNDFKAAEEKEIFILDDAAISSRIMEYPHLIFLKCDITISGKSNYSTEICFELLDPYLDYTEIKTFQVLNAGIALTKLRLTIHYRRRSGKYVFSLWTKEEHSQIHFTFCLKSIYVPPSSLNL